MTQVDHCQVQKGDRTLCLDCKVVLSTEMPTQHRLLVLVFRIRNKFFEKKIEFREKSMWGRLKGDVVTSHNPVKQDRRIRLPKSI